MWWVDFNMKYSRFSQRLGRFFVEFLRNVKFTHWNWQFVRKDTNRLIRFVLKYNRFAILKRTN